MDTLSNLDQSGTNCQFVRTYMGPTLGWMNLPVMPEQLVTSPGPLTIGPYSSRVLLRAGVKVINLPPVSQWMQGNPPLGNTAGFDRSLWIKDLAGLATQAAPIVLVPNGTDTIDGLQSFNIINSYDLIRLYPLTDLSGWYVG